MSPHILHSPGASSESTHMCCFEIERQRRELRKAVFSEESAVAAHIRCGGRRRLLWQVCGCKAANCAVQDEGWISAIRRDNIYLPIAVPRRHCLTASSSMIESVAQNLCQPPVQPAKKLGILPAPAQLPRQYSKCGGDTILFGRLCWWAVAHLSGHPWAKSVGRSESLSLVAWSRKGRACSTVQKVGA